MYGAHCLTWSVHKDCEGAEREATCISRALGYRGNCCSVVQYLQCVCVWIIALLPAVPGTMPGRLGVQ